MSDIMAPVSEVLEAVCVAVGDHEKSAKRYDASEPALTPTIQRPEQGSSEMADITSTGRPEDGKPTKIDKNVSPGESLGTVDPNEAVNKGDAAIGKRTKDYTHGKGADEDAPDVSVIYTDRNQIGEDKGKFKKLALAVLRLRVTRAKEAAAKKRLVLGALAKFATSTSKHAGIARLPAPFDKVPFADVPDRTSVPENQLDAMASQILLDSVKKKLGVGAAGALGGYHLGRRLGSSIVGEPDAEDPHRKRKKHLRNIISTLGAGAGGLGSMALLDYIRGQVGHARRES